MWVPIIAMVSFIILFISLFRRYYNTTDLKNPSKVELGTMILSILTYVLVVKVILSYILTFLS